MLKLLVTEKEMPTALVVPKTYGSTFRIRSYQITNWFCLTTLALDGQIYRLMTVSVTALSTDTHKMFSRFVKP